MVSCAGAAEGAMISDGEDYWTLADKAERTATQTLSPVARYHCQQLAVEYRALAKLKQAHARSSLADGVTPATVRDAGSK